jgi:hypothetical protein
VSDLSEHLGPDLSALLVGELSPREAAAAREHLAGGAACRAELADVEGTRSLLRALPFVDPPAGFVDGFIGTRRRRRHQAMVVAVVASVATLVTLASSGAFRDVPEMDTELATRAEAPVGEPMGEPTPPAEVDEPVPVVDRLAEYERTAVHVDGHLVQISFADEEDEHLTLFEGYGRFDQAQAEEEGEPMDVEVAGSSEPAWMVHLDRAKLLVIEVGDVVYALVTDGPGQDLIDAAEDLPVDDDDDGMLHRTSTVVVRIGDAFSP